MALEAGLEPATNRLTVDCSTIELLQNTDEQQIDYIGHKMEQSNRLADKRPCKIY